SCHLIGWGLYSRPLSDDSTQSLDVGLIQGNIPTSQKLTSAGVQESRQVYLEGYETLVESGAQLVITPEGALPESWNSFTQASNVMMRAVIQRRIPLLLGIFAHEDIEDSQTPLTQSLLMLTAEDAEPDEGRLFGRYNKVKLVPLGEYLPFEKTITAILGQFSPLVESLAPGTFSQQLETPFGPMAAGICYESAFAELFRQQVHNGGQAIFTASNNDPYPPRQMMQHHAQDVMRAIETDRWEVRVTNTGISGFVNPRGKTLWLSEPSTLVTHQATIYRRQTQTPYVRWGDWLTPLLLLLSSFLLLSL
ncbi:MAG: apolipoprotein N-acyltransferase, partial [Cyanobacteria bacterium J06649_4]